MKPLSVVVASSNSKTTQSLVHALYNHFRMVNAAHDLKELPHLISQHRADVAVIDLEFANFNEIRQFSKEFTGTTFVCTHRLADEKMWAEALAAGATDCCTASDVRAIVLAATQTKPTSQAHAA